jgi:hypothetical protein
MHRGCSSLVRIHPRSTPILEIDLPDLFSLLSCRLYRFRGRVRRNDSVHLLRLLGNDCRFTARYVRHWIRSDRRCRSSSTLSQHEFVALRSSQFRSKSTSLVKLGNVGRERETDKLDVLDSFPFPSTFRFSRESREECSTPRSVSV